jgi:DNA-binding transcriptional LysR family regulator
LESRFSYWLVCPQSTLESERIRAFRDWLMHEAAAFEAQAKVEAD